MDHVLNISQNLLDKFITLFRVTDHIGYCLFPFLILNTIIDLRKRKILLWTIPAFLVIGVVMDVITKQDWFIVAAGAGIGILMLSLSVLTKNSVGIGDGIVILICGIFLGFIKNFILIMGAFFLASVYGVFLVIIKKANKSTEIPFIPFLLLSYIMMFFLVGETV